MTIKQAFHKIPSTICRQTEHKADQAELDLLFMKIALEEAGEALLKKEVPVGAVLVCDEKIIATGHNLRESKKDPTAHAELIVLQEASALLGRWRLGGTLYTTLEPCTMCAGALVLARIDRLVFGALDPKAGGCGSIVDVVQDPRFNHRIEVKAGVLAEGSKNLLQTFFKNLRKDKEKHQPQIFCNEERWPSSVEGA